MGTRLHEALIRSSAAHRKRSRQRFQELDLSEGQPKVIAHLLKEQGVTQRELAAKCRVEPATMTSTLNSMSEKSLIRREGAHVSGGKRANRIYLTEHGMEMAGEVIQIVDELEEISYRGFTADERATLVALLSRITENLN